MTGEALMFTELQKQKIGKVTFGDNDHGNTFWH